MSENFANSVLALGRVGRETLRQLESALSSSLRKYDRAKEWDKFEIRADVLRLAIVIGALDPGNRPAIDALAALLQDAQDEWHKFDIAESLATIAPDNLNAVLALCNLFENTTEGPLLDRTKDALLATITNKSSLKILRRLRTTFKKSLIASSAIGQEMEQPPTPGADSSMEIFKIHWADIEVVRSNQLFEIVWNCMREIRYEDFRAALAAG